MAVTTTMPSDSNMRRISIRLTSLQGFSVGGGGGEQLIVGGLIALFSLLLPHLRVIHKKHALWGRGLGEYDPQTHCAIKGLL